MTTPADCTAPISPQCHAQARFPATVRYPSPEQLKDMGYLQPNEYKGSFLLGDQGQSNA